MFKPRIIAIIFIIFIIIVAFLSYKTLRTAVPESSSLPKIINTHGDVRLFENEFYSITYSSQNKQYVISILASPFETYKFEGEKKLLELLSVSEEQACTMNVLIITPHFANPEYAGKKYSLSYCALASPIPPLTIDPNLKPLTYRNIHPPQGEAELGDTRNSIFITFSRPINLQTAAVFINEPFSVNTSIHPIKTNELIIIPNKPWKTSGNYFITVKAGLRSADNLYQLKTDLVLQFTILKAEPAELPPGGI